MKLSLSKPHLIIHHKDICFEMFKATVYCWELKPLRLTLGNGEVKQQGNVMKYCAKVKIDSQLDIT